MLNLVKHFVVVVFLVVDSASNETKKNKTKITPNEFLQ